MLMLRAGTLLLAVTSMSGCIAQCVYDVDDRRISPDGRYELVSYSKSCGAMANARRGISLVPAGTELSVENDARVLYYESVPVRQPATAMWQPDGSIEVVFDPQLQAITRSVVVARVPVHYRALASTDTP